MDGRANECETFRQKLVHCLYIVGLVGLKTESFESTSWAETSVVFLLRRLLRTL